MSAASVCERNMSEGLVCERESGRNISERSVCERDSEKTCPKVQYAKEKVKKT